jgi:hypothetical protein
MLTRGGRAHHVRTFVKMLLMAGCITAIIRVFKELIHISMPGFCHEMSTTVSRGFRTLLSNYSMALNMSLICFQQSVHLAVLM